MTSCDEHVHILFDRKKDRHEINRHDVIRPTYVPPPPPRLFMPLATSSENLVEQNIGYRSSLRELHNPVYLRVYLVTLYYKDTSNSVTCGYTFV